MADLKITELPATTSLVSSDVIPFVNILSSVTSQIPVNSFLANIPRVTASIFTSISAVWMKPINLIMVDVEAWGGGGGGGAVGRLMGAAGGGGGGSYIKGTFLASNIPEAVSIVAAVSVGGVRSGSSVVVGNDGNTTTFGTLLSAYGGEGGSVTAGTVVAGTILSGSNGGSILSSVAPFYGVGGLRSSVAAGGMYSSGSGGTTVGSIFGSGNTIYGGAGGSSANFAVGTIVNTNRGVAGLSTFGGGGGESSVVGISSVSGGDGSFPGGGGGGAIGSSMLSGTGSGGQVKLTIYTTY